MEVKVSSEATLKKYGLTEDEWWWHFKNQKGCCGVCGREFLPDKTINIDHEHVKNWKKMVPEMRKIYVRGLCCWQCNRFYLFRGATSRLALGMYRYLKGYEDRRDNELKRFHSGIEG